MTNSSGIGTTTITGTQIEEVNPKFLNSDHTFTWLDYNADKDCYPDYLFDDSGKIITPFTYMDSASYRTYLARANEDIVIGSEECGEGTMGEISTWIQKLFIFLKGVKKYNSIYINGATNKVANLQHQVSKTSRAIAGILKIFVQRIRNWVLKKIKELVRGILEMFLTPLLKQIKESIVKLALDQIFCVFDNIIDGLVDLVLDFLYSLIGQVANAPFCAVESWTNALINNLVNTIDNALAPVFDQINDLLGGVAKIAGSVMSAVDTILGYEGLFCKTPNCPSVHKFTTSIWGGPKSGWVENWNDFEFLTDNFAEGVLETANDWMDNFFGEDTGEDITYTSPTGTVHTFSQSPGQCYAGTFECGLPQVMIFGGGGTGAAVQAVVNTIGQVIGTNILNAGEHYTSPPFVSIVDPAGCGNNASAGAFIGDDGTLEDIVITNPGDDYSDGYTGGAPVISSFVGAPNPIVVNQTVSLSWDVANADLVSLKNQPGFAALPIIGTVNIPITDDMVQFPSGSDTTTIMFTLIATKTKQDSADEITERDFILTVQKEGSVPDAVGPNTDPPEIESLSLSQYLATPGDVVNIMWQTNNATSVSLDVDGASSLPSDGSLSVVIPLSTEFPTGSTSLTQTYTLTVINENAPDYFQIGDGSGFSGLNTNKQKTQTVDLTIELINDKKLIFPDDEDPTTLPDDVGVDPIPTDTDPDTTTTTPDDIVSVDDDGDDDTGSGDDVDTTITSPDTTTTTPSTGNDGSSAISIINQLDIINTGIGYTPGDTVEIVNGGGGPDATDDGDGSNGASATIEVNEAGQIVDIDIVSSGYGFTRIPRVRINSRTGVGADFRTRLKFIPLSEFTKDNRLQSVDPNKLVQVVDCVS